MKPFGREQNELRILHKAKQITEGLQTTKENISGITVLDSPEFSDLKITSLTVDATLGNTVKSVKSYLTQLWVKLGTHTGLTTSAHGGIVAGTDGRLTDSRTPLAHKSSHASGGADALTPADIGAAATSDLAGKQANLGGYVAGAPSAGGYVTVVIGGTTYKLLAAP
jgi:hypothetical protein